MQTLLSYSHIYTPTHVHFAGAHAKAHLTEMLNRCDRNRTLLLCLFFFLGGGRRLFQARARPCTPLRQQTVGAYLSNRSISFYNVSPKEKKRQYARALSICLSHWLGLPACCVYKNPTTSSTAPSNSGRIPASD